MSPKWWQSKETRAEAWALFDIAWPGSLQMLFVTLIPMVNLAIVGQKVDTTEMAAVGLALSFISVTGISVGFGLASGYDTLGAQANGSGHKAQVGVLAQRALAIMFLAILPISALWMNATQLLIALSFDAKIAELVGNYVLMSLPVLPGVYISAIAGKFLQVQQKVKPLVVVGILANIVHVILCYVLVFKFDYGLEGSVIANIASEWTTSIATIVIIRCYGIGYECWPGFTWEALKDMSPYLRLAMPGMMMMCIEWWSFEVCQFLAGILGPTELATQVSIQSVISSTFMFSLGVGIATSVQVGNHLGAGLANAAKLVSKISIYLNLLIGTFWAVVFMVLRENIVRMFSHDEAVLDMASTAMIVVAMFQIADCIQASCSGVLRGSGHQGVGSVVNLCGYWIIGIPAGAALALAAGQGVTGLWLGLMASLTVQSIGLTTYIYHLNWDKEVALAKIRTSTSDSAGDSDATGMEMDKLKLLDNNDEDDGNGDDDELLILKDENESLEECDRDQKAPEQDRAQSGTSSSSTKTARFGAIIFISLSVSLLIVGISIREAHPPPQVCYPVPIFPNVTIDCGPGHVSAKRGDSCTAKCVVDETIASVLRCGGNSWDPLVLPEECGSTSLANTHRNGS